MDWKEMDTPEMPAEEVRPDETSSQESASEQPAVAGPESKEAQGGLNAEQKKVFLFAGIGFFLVLALLAAVFIIRGLQREEAPTVCRHYGDVPEESVAHVVSQDDPKLLFGLSRVVYSQKDSNWAFVGIDTKGMEKYKAYVHKEKCPICEGESWVVKVWGPLNTTEKPGDAPGDLP